MIIKKMSSDKKSSNRVLLMDDDTMVLDVASRMLSHLGFDSMTAKDGEEAVELYTQAHEIGEPFDVVILDLTIKGGMGGEETIKKLIEFDPTVTALVSSGYTNDPIVSNYKQFGFKDIVAKPYNIKELQEKLSKISNN
jgi:CheY-like chemotaxis protein